MENCLELQWCPYVQNELFDFALNKENPWWLAARRVSGMQNDKSQFCLQS